MTDTANKPESRTRWKTIPIFISSTFRDMHAERDQLNNKVFPDLEEKLRERRCRLEPIDLRVGVDPDATESEREREQRILKVCLQEIDRSRPFLLVLLGDRYGWVPEEDRIKTATGEAGFETVTVGRSVTSLEIEYGLLRKNDAQRQRSILLLRNPLPYDRMGEKAAIYSDEFATDLGASERARHLKALKTKLTTDPLLSPHVHEYTLGWDEKNQRPTGLEAWGEMVAEALWKQLDAETLAFFREPGPTWQEQERFALEEFTERLDRSFAGREALVNQAVEFALSPVAEGTLQALCITAESGAGKSAFFSRVYTQLKEQKGPILLAEAGGISPRAGRLYWTLRRWTGELAAAMGIKADLPDDLQVPQLEERFAQMLAYAADQRRIILVADALNQFERTDRMAALSWLPDPLPANVRLLATAIPGAESDKLARRKGTRISPLPAFTATEVAAVANSVYARYHREPAAEVVAQLAAIQRPDGQPAAGNALWLTLALELLNLLDADDFAEAESDSEGRPEDKLRRLVLRRCRALPPAMEQLYGQFLRQVEKAAGTAEARVLAAALALSRYGWREDDLKVLLSPIAALLFPEQPPVEWDALRFATFRRFFRAHMVRRGEFEQFDFAHSSLRAAILHLLQSAWKPSSVSPDPIPALHTAVADCLEGPLYDSPSRPDEMMNQTLGTRNLTRFMRYYAQPTSGSGKLAEFLVEESHASGQELLLFVLSSLTDQKLPQAEQAVVGHKFNFDLHAALGERDGWALQRPLLEAAAALFGRLVGLEPNSADFARDLSVSYNKMGDLHLGLGHGEQALEFYQKQLDLAEELHRRNPNSADFARDLSVSYDRMCDLHRGLGHGEQALEFYEKYLAIAEELHRRNPNSADFARDLSVSYERMGDLMLGWRRFEEAKTHYQHSLTIREELALLSPQSADFARDVAVGFWHLGDLSEKSGAPDSQDWWIKTFEKLDHMKQRGILPASDEQDYQQVRQKAGIEN